MSDDSCRAAVKDPEVVTFGCRVNLYESEVMRHHARDAGLRDAVIVNTCAVTAEAERQARQTVRRLRRERPGATLVVTGCAAQINPQRFADMGADLVLGNTEKLKAANWAPSDRRRVVAGGDVMTPDAATTQPLLSGFKGKDRAFVQVQQGCDHRCTFCIIPYTRGPNRSVPIDAIVEQVSALNAHGYQEVVLTGIDVTAYGVDLPEQPPLGQVVRRLLRLVPNLPRLRLSSLDPVEIDPHLEQVIVSEPRLMPNIHLSAQSGDDMILKRMKRRHLRHHLTDLANRLRDQRPDLTFGADLIAGFPTESEAMFENSLTLIEELRLTHLHVFPYSPRPGVPASRMPAQPPGIARARAARLRAAGTEQMRRLMREQVGAELDVLFETETSGKSQHYLTVRVNTPQRPGTLRRVAVIAVGDNALRGEVME